MFVLEVQDLMVFFGTDKIGNMIVLCVNQNYNLKQSNSLIHIQDPTGLEFTNQGIYILILIYIE